MRETGNAQSGTEGRSRVVLFGATGYTGELTARALVARGIRPVLAARTERTVRELADALGQLEWAVADVDRPDTVHALVNRGDVLISTVGPFSRWGEPAVAAAIAAGAHYLDSTGEPAFIRRIFEEWGPRAERSGCALLTAMGFDFAPGNAAAEWALRAGGPGAVRVDVGYFLTGDMMLSAGSTSTIPGINSDPSFTWQQGRIVTEPGGTREPEFIVDGIARRGRTGGATEHFAIPKMHAGVRDVEVSVGVIGRVLEPVGRGADALTRARAGSIVVARAAALDRRVLADVRFNGGYGYDITASLLAWGAEMVAAGRLRGFGALGPVEAFGLDELTEGLRHAGVSRHLTAAGT